MLVFRPRKTNKLLNEWQGLFIIAKKLTPVTPEINTDTMGKRHQVFCVNGVKK